LSNVIVFDLDGVITSEEAYWVTAGMVVHELLFSPRYWHIARHPSLQGNDAQRLGGDYKPPTTAEECIEWAHATLPVAVILKLKARAVNSNWDTCYVGACLCLIELLAKLLDCSSLLPLQPWDADWLTTFRFALAQLPDPQIITPDAYRCLDDPFFQGITGIELLERLNEYASQVLGQPVTGVFGRYSQSWYVCQELFQGWYLGDELYTQEHAHPPMQSGKQGIIHLDRPLLPVEQIRATLEALRERGYTLGIATGRLEQEAIVPLKNYGLWDYFEPRRVKTHTDVALAEERLRAELALASPKNTQENKVSLSKPHPYQFLAAENPDYLPNQPLPAPGSFIVVGDTPSDVRGGRAANAITVAVLTGARTAEARQMLEQSQPDFLLDDVTHLPALMDQIDNLLMIQQLQFTHLRLAERLLQRWFARHMDIVAEQVTLTPKAVSLNSFNGIYRVDGQDYFFKTHVEDKGVLAEYYHAELLFKAGYNVVRPLRTLHEKGRQMVVYPVIHSPVMFDLMRAVETGQASPGSGDLLIAAEKRECDRLLAIYAETLQLSSASEHARAPIHQLLWHRLAGERLTSFYVGKSFPLPAGSQTPARTITFEELQDYHWIINGVEVGTRGRHGDARQIFAKAEHTAGIQGAAVGTGQALSAGGGGAVPPISSLPTAAGGKTTRAWPVQKDDGHPEHGPGLTLRALLELAQVVLQPAQEMYTIIGHGDAHFGNVFLEDKCSFQYFDPAFAGRHTPLLDIVKPFFHNVFAMWMYFPDEIARHLQITVDIVDDYVVVEHNYQISEIRLAIWETKIEHLLKPLLALLRSKQALPPDWFDLWRLALLCCPLLTVNLLDKTHRPASICWLGLSQAMQMGNLNSLDIGLEEDLL
jgi:phosphoglycolate phosphatase-like HAD superfamily hydrolase